MKTPSPDHRSPSTTSRPRRRGVGLLLLATLGGCGAAGEDGTLPPDTQMEQQAQLVTTSDEKSHATAVASNGTDLLWAWPELVGGFTQIRLQFRDVNGNAIGASALLTNSSSNKRDLTVAAGADGKFLVAWEQQDATGTAIKGTVVQNLGSGQLAVFTGILTIAPAGDFLHPRAVFAANRSKFLVVFHQATAAVGSGQINARFVSPSGALDPTFVVANVPGARLSVPSINRISEPEVAYAPSTGMLLVTMESFGTGFEHIFASTIPPTVSNADQPMDLAQMDGAAPVFNKSTDKFVVAMIDDLSNGGINLATLAAGCRSNAPASCQITRSATNVVKPATNGSFANIAAAPLGSGVMVTASQSSFSSAGLALSHHFFDSGMALIRTTSLGSSSRRVFGTNSTAEVSSTRAVASDTLIDGGGDVHSFFITSAPSSYVVSNNF